MPIVTKIGIRNTGTADFLPTEDGSYTAGVTLHVAANRSEAMKESIRQLASSLLTTIEPDGNHFSVELHLAIENDVVFVHDFCFRIGTEEYWFNIA